MAVKRLWNFYNNLINKRIKNNQKKNKNNQTLFVTEATHYWEGNRFGDLILTNFA